MLGAALHGVQHGHGAAAAQQDQAGAQAVRGEELRDGNQDRAPRQDGPPLQERHQAELRHQMGNRRERKPGKRQRRILNYFNLQSLVVSEKPSVFLVYLDPSFWGKLRMQGKKVQLDHDLTAGQKEPNLKTRFSIILPPC